MLIEQKSLEKEISSVIAKHIKEFTGKGPQKMETVLCNNVILIKIFGHILPYEKALASTDQGVYDVKWNRSKWVCCKEEVFRETISNILGKDVTEIFYDVKPQNDTALLVAYFK